MKLYEHNLVDSLGAGYIFIIAVGPWKNWIYKLQNINKVISKYNDSTCKVDNITGSFYIDILSGQAITHLQSKQAEESDTIKS